MVVQSRNEQINLISSRIQKPLDGRDIRNIGLATIAGTHGTQVSSIVRLARDGYFSGGTQDEHLGGTFHVTPNLMFRGWAKMPFHYEIARMRAGYEIKSPIETSIEYAEMGGDQDPGVVIGFDKKIISIVRAVDMDDVLQEPEVVLGEAPSIEAVRMIYPVNCLALTSLKEALEQLH